MAIATTTTAEARGSVSLTRWATSEGGSVLFRLPGGSSLRMSDEEFRALMQQADGLLDQLNAEAADPELAAASAVRDEAYREAQAGCGD